MVYCPYTDKDLPESETNSEHIIPLSLGGINGFEIPVCKIFNSKIGSKIDGAVANDFLIQMKRNEFDVRGHSKKKPVFVAKKSKDTNTGQPIQVTFDRQSVEGLKIWCPINREYTKGGRTVSSSITMDIDIDLKFVAKVALSVGFFAYGDLFRNHVKHEELRLIMNKRPKEMGNKIFKIETRVDKRFSNNKNEQLQIFRALCKAVSGNSIVGLVPTSKTIGVFVGILGYYMGMVNVPANTDNFPNEGEYDWGHVISPQNGMLIRTSFRNALQKLMEKMQEV